MASLEKELVEARRVLNEAQAPDRTGPVTILTEAVLVLAAGVLWWAVRDTAFVKSVWFPWIAVAFPIVALGVPLAVGIRNKRRRANTASHGTLASSRP